ncbi:MAG: hypothetical protein LBJ62_00245 [Bifidobacteriaceae bacterium]|jgi:acetyl-CoA acetyltransferase|nr:hypothetical protein [Bifidobacteriaceae bacterium]
MSLTTAVENVAITGIGETEFVRGTDKSTRRLAMQSSLAACRDAGIEPSSIDGLVIAGNDLSIEDYITHLGIDDLRFHASLHIGGATPVASIILAARVVQAGMASRVLVPSVWAAISAGTRLGSGAAELSTRWADELVPTTKPNLEYPYGTVVPMQWYSFHANRYFAQTGADPIGMERVALSTRKHANQNPKAYFRDRTLSSEQYRASEILVKPFHLFDISLETDGSAAVIVQAASRPNTTNGLVYIAGGAEGHPAQPDTMTSRTNVLDMGLTKAAKHTFADLGMRADQADFAEIYDCFTFVALRQMEELGLCGLGEAPDFAVESRIGPGGSFPVNTHGGLLSQAHVLGMNHVTEAVKQLRGQAGAGQVPDARIGLVTGYGDFSNGSVMVLRN